MTTEQTEQPVEILPKLTVDTLTAPAPISRVIELRNKGLTYKEIGKILGCSKQAIHQRLAPFIPSINNLDTVKKNRVDKWIVIEDTMLNSLTVDDIKRMNGDSKVRNAAIAADKINLPSLQINIQNNYYNTQSTKLSELDKEIQQIEAELGMDQGPPE